MNQTSIIFAFVAGLVSFVAPCVLPLIPGFLAYLAGSSLDQVEHQRKQIFLNSVFFVLGFSSLFAVIGVLLNSILSAVAYDVQTWLSRLGGLVIIFFGLYLTGLIKVGFLAREHKVHVSRKFASRYFTSFLFGAAFAVGWTPCVGAVLGAILALAATQPGTAFSLLLAYAFGLGVPFLLVGLFADRAAALIKRYGRFTQFINGVFGVLLIGLGVLVFTQSLTLIANFQFINNLLL